MRSLLFGKNIAPACEYCSQGKKTADSQMILCLKHGVVSPYYHCRKFNYDPLKRIPRSLPALKKYSDKDFSLED